MGDNQPLPPRQAAAEAIARTELGSFGDTGLGEPMVASEPDYPAVAIAPTRPAGNDV